jgi:hypothetical protein
VRAASTNRSPNVLETVASLFTGPSADRAGDDCHPVTIWAVPASRVYVHSSLL